MQKSITCELIALQLAAHNVCLFSEYPDNAIATIGSEESGI